MVPTICAHNMVLLQAIGRQAGRQRSQEVQRALKKRGEPKKVVRIAAVPKVITL